MMKKTEMGVCPKCGGDNIEYSDLDYEGDYLVHKCTCCDCHTFFREFEIVEYDGYELDDVEYSRDGEKI